MSERAVVAVAAVSAPFTCLLARRLSVACAVSVQDKIFGFTPLRTADPTAFPGFLDSRLDPSLVISLALAQPLV